MGLFDFVGTFFFLSLGITFVLILLLVYHFKQRLTDMEQKSDKMFEIINTIVKEMGNMRRTLSEFSQEAPTRPVANYRDDTVDSDDDDDAEDMREDDYGDEPDAIVYTIGDAAPATRTMNEFFHIQEQEPVEQVKVVSVDLTYNEEDVHTDDETSSPRSDFGEFEPEDNPLLPSGEEVVHVNKLEETMPPAEDVESEVEPTEQHQQIPYAKMNLTQLRTYAISRGLLSDSSKMKKAELVKLLESNDVEAENGL